MSFWFQGFRDFRDFCRLSGEFHKRRHRLSGDLHRGFKGFHRWFRASQNLMLVPMGCHETFHGGFRWISEAFQGVSGGFKRISELSNDLKTFQDISEISNAC